MGKLTAAKRARIPKSEFGLPGAHGGKGAYPMPDKSHARNAKARASQAVNEGRMSESTKAKIDAKADAKLGNSQHRRPMNSHGNRHGGKHEAHHVTEKQFHKL